MTPHVTARVTPASYTQGRRWGVVGPERARASANRHLIASGVALGVGIWFKPVALLLLPVLLPRLGTWRDRVTYTALAIAPAAIGTLPFLILPIAVDGLRSEPISTPATTMITSSPSSTGVSLPTR